MSNAKGKQLNVEKWVTHPCALFATLLPMIGGHFPNRLQVFFSLCQVHWNISEFLYFSRFLVYYFLILMYDPSLNISLNYPL